MSKMKIELDSQPALQEVNQITQAVKSLYQLLQQVKGVFKDLGLGNAPGGASYFGGSASGAAQSSATAGATGINLAGAVGSTGGLNIGALLGVQGVTNAVQNLNPSIALAQNQSVMSGLSGGNPARRDQEGLTGSTSAASRLFSGLMGDPSDFYATRGGFAGSGPSFGHSRRLYESSASAAYQGAVGNAAFDDVMYRWNYSGGGLQERGFSGDSYDRLGALRQMAVDARASNIAQTRMAIGSTLLYGGAQLANQYAQSVVSGDRNLMGFANTYGSIAGGVIGGFAAGFAGSAAAGATVGSVVPGIGTLIGAGIGAALGGGLASAAASPAAAKLETQRIGAATSINLGISSLSFAKAANEASGQLNESWASNQQPGFMGWLNGLKDRFGRATHLYSGDDVVSQQDVAQTMTSLYSANLSNGTAMSFGEMRTAGQNFIRRYGTNSADIAQRLAPALSKARANGNNLADLVDAAGLDSTLLYAKDKRDFAGASSLAANYGRTLDARYALEGSQSIAQGAGYDYAASSLGGRSFSQRSGAFQSMQSALQSEIGAVDGQISAEMGIKGGGDSNKVKALNALKKQLYAEITRNAEGQAAGVLSDKFGEGGVSLSAANVGLTKANLYGSAASFAGAGRELLGALSGEEKGIRSAMSDPNLSYSDRLRAQTRLNEIGSQRIAVPAQMAGAAMRRNFQSADVSIAQAGYGYNYASAYGTDSDLGAAALGGMNAQQGVIGAATKALLDPSLSVDDRAAAQMRISGAQNAQLQFRVGSRDTLLGRIAGRAGVAQGAAGFALSRAAMLGTGNDLRAASGGLVGAFNDETNQINAQLKAGGLTVEQELRLKGRLNSLNSERFGAEQSAIDGGNVKDDLIGYTTPARKLQGQMERLQYLPFSASSPIKLSLQQISLNKRQLGVLDAREAALRSAGNLSPERQDEIEGQRQTLYTQNAAAVSTISEGFINRLPGLSAGAPSFSGRLNSFSMAAAQLNLMGSPIRSFGAANGGSLRTQDDFIRAAGFEPGDIGPRSRTAGLNGGEETNVLLRRIAEALERGSGSATNMRPGDAAGTAYANLARRDLGQSGARNTHN